MALPPLWSPRASSLQTGAVAVFTAPVAGAAAWMGSREARRHVTDLVSVTARPGWARQLATWAATAGWAIVGYLGCLAAVYGVTAHQAHWGGPLWWPAAVAAATLLAVCRARVRGRDAAAQPVHRAGDRDRGVLRGRAQHPADRRQPVVLERLPHRLRPVGHWCGRRSGDVLPVRPRPGHRPGDVPGRGHRGRARPAGPGGRSRRAAAASPGHGGHHGRGAGRGNRRGAGRDRHDGPTRHDRHSGAARRSQRPAAAVHPGVQPHRHPGLPEPGLRQLPARHRGRAAAGAQPAGRPVGNACPDQPGRRRLPPGTRQRGRHRPGWAPAHRHAAGLPAAAARPAHRAHADA